MHYTSNSRSYTIIFIIFSLSFFFLQCECSAFNSTSGKAFSIFIDAIVPQEIVAIIKQTSSLQGNAFIFADNPDTADIVIHPRKMKNGIEIGKWYYAVCTPFYSIPDNIDLSEIERLWKRANNNSSSQKTIGSILIDQETSSVLETILGQGNPQISEEETLIDRLYELKTSYTITPFHKLVPKLKVLNLSGFHLLDKNALLDNYPLILHLFASGKKNAIDYLKKIVGTNLENRDESKMTVIIMTGTTALTRQTAFMMEKNGVEYPGERIKQWLQNADFTHVSNEVSFIPDCKLDNSIGCMKFCSDEKYLSLFDSIGVDIIELSGNHLTDFGTAPLDHTLDLFEKKGYRWYAGGRNIADAEKPLYIESGPNRIAFIGACAGPSYHFATNSSSGPLKADFNQLKNQIIDLKKNNWLPIVTIQYWETYEYFPTASQIDTFRFLANAGAVIVQGSQAHQPQSFDFCKNAFIHYGLGNLFFDQMWSLGTRQEFIDRHIFYNNKHISTELLTAMLEDYSRPRPMREEERKSLLLSTYSQSFWKGNRY
jgi:hypothetical protein